MGNAGYEEVDEPKELPAYYISETDKERLLQIASLEAGNQGVDGMAYVMQTVLNRVFDHDFPMTVEGVLFQENQFTTANKLTSLMVQKMLSIWLQKANTRLVRRYISSQCQELYGANATNTYLRMKDMISTNECNEYVRSNASN